MNNKKAVIAGRVITGIVGVFFAYNAMVKLFYETLYPPMAEQLVAIGLSLELLPRIAILELLCVVVYLIPKTSVLGAVLFTGYLGGAILTHMRVGDNVAMHVVFGGLIWLGIYLREPKLHKLLPIRRN